MLRKFRRELSVAAAYLLLLILLAVFAPAFYSIGNVRDILLNNVPVLVAAIGMTLIILIGQIDISIGAQFAICGIAAGVMAKAGLPMPLLALMVAAAGGLLGLLNGALIALLNIPSIVVTLAMMVALRDGLRWSTGGTWVQNLPARFQWWGLGQEMGQWVVVLAAVVVFAVFAWALEFVAAGRAVYATGASEDAARLAGIPTRRIRLCVFVMAGMLVGLAALLNSIRFLDIQSNGGVGLEMKAIAAVVIGGTSINGGRGTLWGTLLGVALLGTIGPALTFFGISPYWEKAVQGGIILAAVFSDAMSNRGGRRA